MAKPKVLWAFNPFEENSKLAKNVAGLLQKLLRAGFAVEPVYVVSPAEANVALEFSVSEEERFQTVSLRAAERALKKLKLPGLLPPRILVQSKLSTSASAASLSAYAKKEKAATIVTATHAREGLRRILLGSFAESLLSASKTPLLLVNPALKPLTDFKKLLFATDFSAASLRAFRGFCAFAKQLRASVQLFHVLPMPFPWASMDTEFLWEGAAVSVGEYFKLLRGIREKEARKFDAVARDDGVKMTVAIEPSGQGVGSAVVSQAKKSGARLIGLAAQSGRLRTAILGAASRGVIREAQLPVWVQRE